MYYMFIWYNDNTTFIIHFKDQETDINIEPPQSDNNVQVKVDNFGYIGFKNAWTIEQFAPNYIYIWANANSLIHMYIA
jgi:hypothetical protein